MYGYEKDVKDTYDDVATVHVYERDAADGDLNVYLNVADSLKATTAKASYTPKQARRLARALKRAANVAEGKPAKSKPAVIVDGDGDTWHLSPNGKYGLYRPEDDATMTRADIRRTYGLAERG